MYGFRAFLTPASVGLSTAGVLFWRGAVEPAIAATGWETPAVDDGMGAPIGTAWSDAAGPCSVPELGSELGGVSRMVGWGGGVVGRGGIVEARPQ